MTQKQDTYKQTEFGKFSNAELLAFFQSDEVGTAWLEETARQLLLHLEQRGAKYFGIEGAKEVVIAMVVKGYYSPKKEVVISMLGKNYLTKG